jgi:hypothetical protein
MIEARGTCFCGEVRFTVTVDPSKVALCHCLDCQQVSGSAFRHTVFADKTTLEFQSGDVTRFDKVGDSGKIRRQLFCATCGTNIGSVPPEGDLTPFASIRVPILDVKDQLPPRINVWHQSHPVWLDDLADLPSLDQQS